MACNTCNTPASSGGNLPSKSTAYLTDPVNSPAESCYNPPVDPCAPPVSRLRYLRDYIPGWLQKLRPASMGRMLIGVGDVLSYFHSPNKGLLYFDGENVVIGAQDGVSILAKSESVHEFGHITLAKKVSKAQVLPNGDAAIVEFFDIGVQAVREIGVGHMLGLTKDNLSGSVRLDVITPEERNLIAKGLPKGFQRFGYVETLVDGGCGQIEAKEFLSYRGAAYGEDELNLDKVGGTIAALFPVEKGGEKYYVLGTAKDGITAGSVAFSALTDEAGLEEEYDLFSHIAIRWKDTDGDDRISYKDPVNGWYHPVDKRLLEPVEIYGASQVGLPITPLSYEEEELDLTTFGIPEDAKFVEIEAEVKIQRLAFRPPGTVINDVFAEVKIGDLPDPSHVIMRVNLLGGTGVGLPNEVKFLRQRFRVRLTDIPSIYLSAGADNGQVGQTVGYGSYWITVNAIGWSR